MLGANVSEGGADVLAELKERAVALVERLENSDYPGATEMIRRLNETRDRTIYHEVGKLTRGLHEAIVNFQIDAGGSGGFDTEQMSKMANAQERLDYVINLTQKSADKTMDMVEQGMPVAAELGESARLLQADWQRLARREMNADEFRSLYTRIDEFLSKAGADSSNLSETFNSILLAQDFQDLSGQVIKKVITLVQEVEAQLVALMRMAGQVEELTGIFRAPDIAEKILQKAGADIAAEGPQIKAGRTDVVSGQDQVDDLLSSLGF
ncbi:MAG: protein phosphatase CheZ [Spongiibacteraceae bacterium]